jgi:hypothetical protein
MAKSEQFTRFGIVSRRLLKLLAGVLVFLILVSVIGLWLVGRFAPTILDTALSTKAGAGLTCETNQTNLLVGRLSLENFQITNPSRWQEKSFLKVKSLKIDLNPLSFIGGGARHIQQLECDIDELVLVGSKRYMKDNNAQDILRALKGEASPASSAAKPDTENEPTPKKSFLIDNARIRVGHVKIIVETEGRAPEVILDREFNFVFEAKNVTEKNLNQTVTIPLGAQALASVAVVAPRLSMEIANHELRKSITEKLLGEKK